MLALKSVRAITLDLDGTLVDTVGDLWAGCNGMLAELGEPLRSEAEIRSFVGKGMANLVERCLTREGKPTPDSIRLQAGINAFRQHYSAINGQSSLIYPGVIAGLDAMQAAGWQLACVTNKPTQFTLPLLEKLGLAKYFKSVVSGDTLPQKKPSPEPLYFACEQMGVAIADNVHIGDSRHDIAAARAAGCAVICVPYGYNEGKPVDSADCDALVSDLVAAVAWLRER
jgi:phosphoglycolate phosphatase